MNVNLVVMQGGRGRRRESAKEKKEQRKKQEKKERGSESRGRGGRRRGGEDSMAVNLTYRLYFRAKSTKDFEESSEWFSK